MTKPYLTPDIYHAAYLAYKGYTLLGAVEPKVPQYGFNGQPRLVFALIHPNQDKHANMAEDINEHINDFISDRGGHYEFVRKYRMCQKALKNPVLESQL